MSIDDFIIDRVRREMLFPILPRAAGAAPRRAMFVSESLWSVLTSPKGTVEWEQRVAYLTADLEMFVEGLSLDPKYLFLLYPSRTGVWEIRSVRPNPSIRVLGLFAGVDVFVATNYALREDLGGWNSREWKNVKQAASAQWRRVLHPYTPVTTTNVHDVVTGAIDGEYYKQR